MHTSERSDQTGVTFLLKEYEECWAQARHIDEFMERTPRLFLVVLGAVIAAAAALIRFSEVTSATFLALGFVLIIIGLVGVTASLTIPRYRVIRNLYFNAIYRIHEYFASRSEDIGDYIGLQVGGSFEGYRHPLGVDFFRFLMMVVMDTALIGAGLYFVQNASALATNLPAAPCLVWVLVLECAVILALHVSAYFWIIRYYEPKLSDAHGDIVKEK